MGTAEAAEYENCGSMEAATVIAAVFFRKSLRSIIAPFDALDASPSCLEFNPRYMLWIERHRVSITFELHRRQCMKRSDLKCCRLFYAQASQWCELIGRAQSNPHRGRF